MNRLFNFEEYKGYLINHHTYKCDEEKNRERQVYVESRYSDEFLNRVIANTEKFVLIVLKEIYEKLERFGNDVWIETEISSYIFERISNGCIGGWDADRLFCPNELESDVLVSEYLIRNFFGEKFRIDIYDDLMEHYDEKDDVGYITCSTYLTINGSKEKFLEILDSYFQDRNCLVKK